MNDEVFISQDFLHKYMYGVVQNPFTGLWQIVRCEPKHPYFPGNGIMKVFGDQYKDKETALYHAKDVASKGWYGDAEEAAKGG